MIAVFCGLNVRQVANYGWLKAETGGEAGGIIFVEVGGKR